MLLPVKPFTTAGKLILSGEASRKQPGGLGRFNHALGGTLANAFGIAVAPDFRREDRLVPLIDEIAHGLADEVCRNRIAGEAVVFQDLPLLFDVSLVLDRLIDFKMVAPAGEFQTVVAKGLGLLAEVFERQVGPLAGEQGDGTGHDAISFQKVRKYERRISTPRRRCVNRPPYDKGRFSLHLSAQAGVAGIGRRAGLRILCRKA